MPRPEPNRTIVRLLRRRCDLIALAAVLVFGVAVRVLHLNQPMRYDEGYSYNYYASRTLWEAASNYSEPNNHILHTLLMHASTRWFGPGPRAVRLPAFLFGVALIPLIYGVGCRLLGRRAAILAAGLVAGWPYLIHYSTNARGYVIQCAMFLPMIVLARRMAEGFRWQDVLAFAVLGALGLFTVPTTLYGVVMLSLWVLALGVMRGGRGRRLAGMVRAGRTLAIAGAAMVVLTLVLYLPVLLRMGPGQLTGNRFVEPLTLPELLSRSELDSLRHVWGKWNLYGSTVLRVLFWLAIWVGLVALLVRRRTRDLAWLLPAVAIGGAAMMLAMRRIPPARVWTFLLPPCLLLIAAGMEWVLRLLIRRRRVALRCVPAGLAVLIAVSMGTWAYRTRLVLDAADTATFPNVEAVYETLRDKMGPDDALAVACPCDQPLLYYFRRDGIVPEHRSRPRRLFVVTLDEEQTVADVLDETGYRQEVFGAPAVLVQFDRRVVYLGGFDRVFSGSTIHVLQPVPSAAGSGPSDGGGEQP